MTGGKAQVTTLAYKPQPPLRDSSATVLTAEQLLVLDALWNRVTIHADGRGQVAVWSGEKTPIKYFRFSLSARQLASVRRWLAQAASVRRVKQPNRIRPETFMYFIRAPRYSVRMVEADLPRPLQELTHTLDGLIDRYA